jgi:hypothetical protein
MPQNPNQRELAGFLLGLGIGLIVGIVFQPRSYDQSVGIRRVVRVSGNVTRSAPLPKTAAG